MFPRAILTFSILVLSAWGVASPVYAAGVAPETPFAEVWTQRGMSIGSGTVPPPGQPESAMEPNRLMPEVVQVSATLWRMYYGQRRLADEGWDMMYAESADAQTFVPKGIALAGTSNPLDPEYLIRGASMVRLPDGRWRMYYQATPWFSEGGAPGVQPTTQPSFQIMSAVSTDGVSFVREGVRLGGAHGRILKLDDGRYVAYTSLPEGIVQTVSTDGLNFTSAKRITSGHDPFVVRTVSGSYLMYVDTTEGPCPCIVGTVELRASNDGLVWSAPSNVTFLLSTGQPYGSGPDVGGIVMPDGALRLYTNYARGFAWYERTQTSPPITAPQVNALVNVGIGWNLLGNGSNAPWSVFTAFGDPTKVISVWKWNAAVAKWAFYTPGQSDGSAALASALGYEHLGTISAGEGFWVNAKTPFTAQLPVAAAVMSTAFQSMTPGWHLIATGNGTTPGGFNLDISPIAPAAGVVPQNFNTLWAWDNAQSKWYFYAPSLRTQGDSALSDYIETNGYLDFTSAGKTLGPGVGFWVNKP